MMDESGVPAPLWDHFQEVIDKWMAIDDEIWAKIICMERNRRIAKAYARKHTLTIDGSENEYLDGATLGLNSFDNPDRDAKTSHIKQYIGQGIKVKINHNGDIMIKRMSKAKVFVHNIDEKLNVMGSDVGQSLQHSHSISDLQALSGKESSGEIYGVLGNYNRKRPDLKTGHNRQRRLGDRFDENDLDDVKFGISSSGISSSSSGIARHINSSKSEIDCHHGHDFDNKNDSGVAKSQNRHALLKRMANTRLGKASNTTNVIEHERVYKVFDMSKFKAILDRESRRKNPNRMLLQNLCISIVSFVLDDKKILNMPSWIMIINIVAIDLLRTQIGLFDPNGMQLPPALSCTSSNRCDLLAYSALGQRATDIINERSSGGQMRHIASRKVAPLTASKKAFAEAAASGVFDDDDYYDTSVYGEHLEHNCNIHNKISGKANRVSTDKPSKDDLKDDAQYTADMKNKLSSGSSNEMIGDHLRKAQSSSSSGFNSNCFSQNADSSAASSRSNITTSSSGCDIDRTSSEQSETGNSNGIKNNCVVGDEFIRVVENKMDHNRSKAAADRFKSSVAEESLADNMELNHKRIANNVCLAATKAMLFKKQQSKNGAESHLAAQSLETTISDEPLVPRGKRLPKSLHLSSNSMARDLSSFGMMRANGSGHGPIVSGPIPIPAPPTCSGDIPTGKANLILVSPTGLSPPLSRRTEMSCPSLKHVDSTGNLTHREHRNINEGPLASTKLSDFSSIEHIDENGQCSVLIDPSLDGISDSQVGINHQRQCINHCNDSIEHGRQTKIRGQLPAGIPPHAQLAPPATQRHILRYLMSATQHKLVDMIKHKKNAISNAQGQQQSRKALPRDDALPTPIMSYQRPLPILPGQKRPAPLPLSENSGQLGHKQQQKQQPHLQAQEENLYYCGMQARVPNRRVWASNRQDASHSRNLYYY